jgi:hypothetical protein
MAEVGDTNKSTASWVNVMVVCKVGMFQPSLRQEMRCILSSVAGLRKKANNIVVEAALPVVQHSQ